MIHDRIGSPLREALLPPLPREKMGPSFPSAEYELHPAVVALYGWHDGLDWSVWPRPGYPAVFPRGEFRSFVEQAEHQLIMLDAGSGLDAYPLWSDGWFPVFSLGRDTVVVDSSPGPDYGSVWFSSIDLVESFRLFSALEDFVASVIRGFEEGVFVFDGEFVRPRDEDQETIETIVELGRP